jgi:hypothetical protein
MENDLELFMRQLPFVRLRNLVKEGNSADSLLRSNKTEEHIPQLKKRDAATIAMSDVIQLRQIDDGRHLCKLYQAMRFDMIHSTSR